MNKKLILTLTIYTIISLLFVAGITLVKALVLLDMCTGTSTGGNYVYLFCHAEYWMPVSILIDLGLVFIGGLLIKSTISRPWYVSLVLALYVYSAIILLLRAYNLDFEALWFINVTGKPAVY